MTSRRDFLWTTSLGGALGFASEGRAAVAGAEPAKGTVPITGQVGDYDVVVVGGSCTGVFAALRAAEAGFKVALIEMSGGFGGTATQGLVPIWHSLYTTDGKRPIIGGLTASVEQELMRRGEAKFLRANVPSSDVLLNIAGLQLLLDELVLKTGRMTPFLHTRVAAAECDRKGHVSAVIVADKAGLRRVRGKFFIDATGDADVCRYAGLATWTFPKEQLQAHTLCALLAGVPGIRAKYPKFNLGRIMRPEYGAKLTHVFGWDAPIVGAEKLTFLAYTRISTCDPSIPEDLTHAEIEGRAQLRRIVDAVNRAFPMPEGQKLTLVAVAPHVGLRESCHIHGLYKVTGEDILYGRHFDDAIAYGSYRVDIHEGAGITFRYLDGREARQIATSKGVSVWKHGYWRKPTDKMPTWYEIPYRTIVPEGAENVLAPGRMLDCTRDAFGACRVMVNCNQLGEAAGRAAARALTARLPAAQAFVAPVRT